MKIGAHYLGSRQCEFVVWAPLVKGIAVHMVAPTERVIPLEPFRDGYWKAKSDEISPGDLYLFQLGESHKRPDPASHHQPKGVHGPSQIIDHGSFQWQDGDWRGIPLSEMILYELHVGTFTPAGTFEAIIPRLDALREIGVNAIELMPVAQFPGERNWGYDGVYPFAVQHSYGGPGSLKRLVNECHRHGLAVVLDVVYNHLGPEGNYFLDFGPYFTEKYRTPWGPAINFDDSYNYGVRNFFIENALYWFDHYHIDALRLDAIHAIFDMSAKPFLQELAQWTQAFSRNSGRPRYLIAETNQNDVRVISPKELGGYGLDAQWFDDFHHVIHTLLTRENQGYYSDYGQFQHLVKAFRDGFVYSGQYSKYHKRRHGSSSKERPADQFIVFTQNHDQVGNRLNGDRLPMLTSFEALKLVAGVILLSPYIPLLFMGEEYGENAPFFYFVDHSDPDLIEAVRQGRKEEFRTFYWKGEPADPQDVKTFLKSKVNWDIREKGHHRVLLELYKTLIRLRKEIPALCRLDRDHLDVWGNEEEQVVFLKRWAEHNQIYSIFNFNQADVALQTLRPREGWKSLLDSADPRWNGPGTLFPEILRGHSFAVYIEELSDRG